MTDTPTQTELLAKLREPFPAHQVGKKPQPYNKDSQRGNCAVCGGYHGLPAMHLDYVGHAALTQRLLDVDPLWSWEPFAVDQHGLPILDGNGGLWIKLTVCGITRPGYGDAGGKRDGNGVKEAIGDALRNAGMRFGIALDLWHKGDLHEATIDGSNGETAPNAIDEPSVPFDTAPLERQIAAASTKEQLAAVGKAIAETQMPADAKRQLRQEYSARSIELNRAVTA